MLIDVSFQRPIRKASPAVPRRVLILNGHPDPRPERFCAAVCEAFRRGISTSAYQIRTLSLGSEEAENDLGATAEQVWWANRLFIAYPMWVGGPPPPLRRLFETFARQTSWDPSNDGKRDAQVVVTASLPSLLYRAHAANEGRPSILPDLNGIIVTATTIIGSVDTISEFVRARWLDQMHLLGIHNGRG